MVHRQDSRLGFHPDPRGANGPFLRFLHELAFRRDRVGMESQPTWSSLRSRRTTTLFGDGCHGNEIELDLKWLSAKE